MGEIEIFFGEQKPLFVLVHVFSVVVGMGSALVSDVLFNNYIRDRKINPTESRSLEVLSRVIWFSLGMIILSGLAIYLSDPVVYGSSTKFLVKMTVVGVIVLNGFLFWKITHKSLRKFNFSDTNSNHKYVRIRKLSFAFGAVSVVSWLAAFILGSVDAIPVSFGLALGVYGGVILLAILASQVVEFLIVRDKI